MKEICKANEKFFLKGFFMKITPFLNRKEAGQLLAKALLPYLGQDVVVLGLPRGGVVLAAAIAFTLKAPLDLVFAHKIGHPFQPEYAIAAISEAGDVIGNLEELKKVDKEWLEKEKEKIFLTMKQRRKLYLQEKEKLVLTDKIAIIVDDGVATGWTLLAAILEVKHLHPKKIIVAVPIAPKNTADKIRKQVDELVALQIDSDERFLGAVGAYYQEFYQVEDQEVIDLLQQNRQA